MAVVNDHKNEPIFNILEVNVVVDANHLALNQLEQGIPGRPLLHLMSLRNQNLELVSVAIPPDAMVVGKKLGEIELPPHSFISLVVKSSRAELPSPGLVIDGGDEVVAVTSPDEDNILYQRLTGA
jgi:trk system potassium uptake protein TrkA